MRPTCGWVEVDQKPVVVFRDENRLCDGVLFRDHYIAPRTFVRPAPFFNLGREWNKVPQP